jgi:hypothetical protein
MITRRSAALSPIILLLSAAKARAEADIVIPLDTSGPRPSVLIAIGANAAEPWVFDTGAAGGVIDAARAQALGLPNQGAARVGSPAGGTPVEGFITTVSGAHAGAAALPAFRAVAMPMPASLGHTGVLSPNIFRGRLVTFDFAHASVVVSDRVNAPSSEPTPYTGDHPLPAIAVRIGEQTFQAHMDTGAPHLIAFPYALAASLPLQGAPQLEGVARFVDGEHPRYRAQLRGQVQVGPLTLTDPEIGMIDGMPFVNVGAEALRRMVITLDPERRVSWALPA